MRSIRFLSFIVIILIWGTVAFGFDMWKAATGAGLLDYDKTTDSTVKKISNNNVVDTSSSYEDLSVTELKAKLEELKGEENIETISDSTSFEDQMAQIEAETKRIKEETKRIKKENKARNKLTKAKNKQKKALADAKKEQLEEKSKQKKTLAKAKNKQAIALYKLKKDEALSTNKNTYERKKEKAELIRQINKELKKQGKETIKTETKSELNISCLKRYKIAKEEYLTMKKQRSETRNLSILIFGEDLKKFHGTNLYSSDGLKEPYLIEIPSDCDDDTWDLSTINDDDEGTKCTQEKMYSLVLNRNVKKFDCGGLVAFDKKGNYIELDCAHCND